MHGDRGDAGGQQHSTAEGDGGAGRRRRESKADRRHAAEHSGPAAHGADQRRGGANQSHAGRLRADRGLVQRGQRPWLDGRSESDAEASAHGGAAGGNLPGGGDGLHFRERSHDEAADQAALRQGRFHRERRGPAGKNQRRRQQQRRAGDDDHRLFPQRRRRNWQNPVGERHLAGVSGRLPGAAGEAVQQMRRHWQWCEVRLLRQQGIYRGTAARRDSDGRSADRTGHDHSGAGLRKRRIRAGSHARCGTCRTADGRKRANAPDAAGGHDGRFYHAAGSCDGGDEASLLQAGHLPGNPAKEREPERPFPGRQ